MLQPVTEQSGLNWDPEQLLSREWLVTNGLGGYASGTVSGVATRRYHGLLIAALPAPLGRVLLLAHMSEQFRLPDGTVIRIGGVQPAAGNLQLFGMEYLARFELEDGLPVWQYQLGNIVLEKRLLMPHEQNSVYLSYRLLSGPGPLRLKLLPTMHFRSHDAEVSTPLREPYRLHCEERRYEVWAHDSDIPLRLKLWGRRPAFTYEPARIGELLYRVEERRGYGHTGLLWSPGYFRVDLDEECPATMVASTERWESIEGLSPEAARQAEMERRERLVARAHPAAQSGMGKQLVLAADQFLVRPAGRVEDEAWARATGDEVRTVIAGYHWFTDWGRDTMISLEGLTLTTGRHVEAGCILRTFAHYIRDGLIPNLFPEGGKEGLYHTADATLWFFQALHRYLEISNDQTTLKQLLPKMLQIYECHMRGTRFGIGVDPEDGLLRQGEEGYQLTWMDAKVEGWVVTPRRGKAVEINALWYNALRLLADWLRESGDEQNARSIAGHAEQTYRSFNARFWSDSLGHLYDVVDGERGDDDACRPNQLFAISLPHPVLARERWEAVVKVAEARLLTPMGLRSLAPGHPEYKSRYDGDLRSRDAAYHQGTVWGWLIGPFIDAWIKVHPERRTEARAFLDGFEEHLREACTGSISEIFDAVAPFWPRGCVAQAWSVAEVLRCWTATADEA